MNTNIKKYFSINKNDRKFNSLDIEGKALVQCGLESVKKYVAEISRKAEKTTFASILSDIDVNGRQSLDNEVVEKLVKYSLKKDGIDVTDFELKDIANPNIRTTKFKETFNMILAQIMTPIVPAMVSAQFADMADVSNIGWGETAKFDVKSNDTFYVTRIAEGVLSGSVQRLYNDELAVNPEPYNIKTTVDWYQVAAGVYDLGEFVYKVGVSFSAYVTQMIIGAISANIAAAVPASYFTNGFTTSKFIKLAELLRAANGGAKVKAYGSLNSLAGVKPEGTAASGIANMQMQLGEEWSKVGYIGTYMDVDLIKIPQIVLPNTINTTPLLGIPDDVIYMFADGGYKPVKLVFEGSAITIDIIPTESPDKEMGISVTTRMGQTFVAASKYGAITGMSI